MCIHAARLLTDLAAGWSQLSELGSRTDSEKKKEEKTGGAEEFLVSRPLRQEDSGGNTRKPLTNHSIMVIYLLEWATDS